MRVPRQKLREVFFRVLGFGILLSIALILLSSLAIGRAARGRVYDSVEAIPKRKVGLVLGCSKTLADGRTNLFFSKRILAAASLYRHKKVDYLLVSGDNHVSTYDESSDMKDALVEIGVPAEAIYCDYAGFRTFDSVVRAKKVFGEDAITVISQRFHNERAIYIARANGIDAIGFNAGAVDSFNGFRTKLREQLAKVKTILDVSLFLTAPRFLGPTIDIGAKTSSKAQLAKPTLEQKQPSIFLWSHGHFRNTRPQSSFHDPKRGPYLFVLVSYCGADDENPQHPALNVTSNITFLVSGQPRDFSIAEQDARPGGYIATTVPIEDLTSHTGTTCTIQWRTKELSSNILIVDLENMQVNSTTPYPTTPLPEQLKQVKRIEYSDWDVRTRTDKLDLDTQRNISFFFNGDDPLPWRFSHNTITFVHGVKGTNATIRTMSQGHLDMSSEEVLKVWQRIEATGITLPSRKDNESTAIGKNWKWELYPDATNSETYPLGLSFGNPDSGTDAICKFPFQRHSPLWKRVTDIFLEYADASQANAPGKSELTILNTQGDDQPCTDATISALLEDPDKYHGKRVRVTGYHHFEFEHSSLSETKQDRSKYDSSLWFGGVSAFADPKAVQGHNKTYIQAEGTFIYGPGGHMGLWPGELQRITKIDKINRE